MIYFYFLSEVDGILLDLNKMCDRTLIPSACQNPIGLTDDTAGTKQLFHNNMVGNARRTAINVMAINTPIHVLIMLIDLFIIYLSNITKSPNASSNTLIKCS